MHHTFVPPCAHGRDRWPRWLAWLPIPLFLAALALLRAAGEPYVFESSPELLFVLNTAFSFLGALIVAFILGRAFLARSVPSLLVLGAGVMVWGLAGPVASAVGGGDANLLITTHNSCVWLSALCQLVAAWLSRRPRRAVAVPGAWLAASHALGFGAAAVIALMAVTGRLPVFFAQGQGGTWLRHLVMGSAIAMFVGTAVLLKTANRERRSAFVHWYALALLLVAVGLFGVMLESYRGDALSWTGRAAQYLGSVYMFVAALAALRELSARGTSFETVFGETRQEFKELLELAVDGVVVHEIFGPAERGNFVVANPAMCALLGYSARELRALAPADILVPEERHLLPRDMESILRDGMLRHEKTLVAKDGRRIPVEIATRLFRHDGRPRVMSMIRDCSRRKDTEATLRASEERYRSLFESMTEGFALHELVCDDAGRPCDYRFLDINPAFERLTGLAREQVIGRTVLEVLPATEAVWIERFGGVVATGRPDTFEHAHAMLGRHYAVYAYRAGTNRFAVVFSDVTQRVRNEEALRESTLRERQRNAELAAILQAVPAAVWIAHDAECLHISGNRAADELLRIHSGGESSLTAPGEVRPRHFKVLAGGKQAAPEEMPVQMAARGAVLRGHEIAIAFEDGSVSHLLGNAAPLLDEQGLPRGAVAAFIDISKRTRAEEALRTSNCRLGILAEAASHLLAAKDPLALVGHLCRKVMTHLDCHVFFNYMAEADARRLRLNAYAGIPEESARAIEWLDFGEAVCGCVAVRGARLIAEDIAATPDPRTALVKSFGIDAYACHPLMSGERVIGTLSFGTRTRSRFSAEDLGMMKAVADLVAIAMERVETQARLLESNRRKDEFLATLAHELRNPMAPIRNAAHVLRARDGGDPSLGRLCAIIERQIEHMARLVDDLLDLSRIERGKIELRKARVDFRAVVGQAIEVCRPLIDGRSHEITSDVPGDPVDVDADPIRLEQVVCNLVSNACKFTPRQGTIRVTLAREGLEAVLRVRDNGVGLAPEARARVFEPFYQVDHSMGRSEGGLGIGLSLAQRLAGLHGGSIEAQSDGVGKGSEFVFRVPLMSAPPERAPAAQGGAESPTAAAAATAAKHVLIIDDNAHVRESSEMLLAASGFRVSVAEDGTTGLARALALRPDVAIVDIGLPGLNGLEVAAGIRAKVGSGVFLIALSGYGGARERTLSAAAGFDVHLVKPVNPGELLALLNGERRRSSASGAAAT
jgi:PAS domain S-box-containing protein